MLSTSTVVPPRMRSTSFGRIAVPDGMFSAMHSQRGDAHRQAEARGGERDREHGGGAGHVVLHADHRGRRLQREAAGVEGDALADEGEVLGRALRGSS